MTFAIGGIYFLLGSRKYLAELLGRKFGTLGGSETSSSAPIHGCVWFRRGFFRERVGGDGRAILVRRGSPVRTSEFRHSAIFIRLPVSCCDDLFQGRPFTGVCIFALGAVVFFFFLFFSNTGGPTKNTILGQWGTHPSIRRPPSFAFKQLPDSFSTPWVTAASPGRIPRQESGIHRGGVGGKRGSFQTGRGFKPVVLMMGPWGPGAVFWDCFALWGIGPIDYFCP